ncbi:ribosomal protein S10 [Laetiporus sulphureus 93-53]|uniref:Small ribosomal subunit protein uS10m n=1 Tax=Laetiporus sulphureus 93-53 TaxID=1314785 RepID=A0A165BUH6_9APHY|nr:ribosomal protein S10 [Laetiporus sulphureus 93-53]KZT01676.1 ribosomal protein S10 [Laetiporus sulphureus 93-53]
MHMLTLARSCRNTWAVARQCVRANSTAAPSTTTAFAPVTHDQERLWASTIVHGRSMLEPYCHPKTHGIPVALVHFRSYYPELLKLFTHFTGHAAASLGIPVSRTVHLPTQRSLWTVPKGPFVHKKSQENFERKVHKRVIKAWDADQEVVDHWIKYLEEHALAGVGIRVVRWHRAPVGIGETTLHSVMGQMRLPVTSVEQVQALGEEILRRELSAAEDAVAEAVKVESSPQNS